MATPPDGVFFRYKVNRNNSEKKLIQKSASRYGEIIQRLISLGWTPDLLHAHSEIHGRIIAHELLLRFGISFVITEHSPTIMNFYSKWLPIGNEESLAKAIIQIKKGAQPFEPQRLRNSVLERFGTHLFIKKLSSLYHDVLKERDE